jgi:hypothetical protein
MYVLQHKVRRYIEHHSVCPFVGIGTPPTPLPQASVPSPPPAKGWGAHTPAAKGVGESQFRRLEKSLALCLLCVLQYMEQNVLCLVTYRISKRASIRNMQHFVNDEHWGSFRNILENIICEAGVMLG